MGTLHSEKTLEHATKFNIFICRNKQKHISCYGDAKSKLICSYDVKQWISRTIMAL